MNCDAYEDFVGLTARDVRALQKLGREVKRMRMCGRRFVSQAEIADRVGYSTHWLSQLERGVRRPRISSLVVLSKALSELRPELGTCDQIFGRLALLADGLIAPESSTVPDRALTKGTVGIGAEARSNSTVPDRVYGSSGTVTQGTVGSTGMAMGRGQIGGRS